MWEIESVMEGVELLDGLLKEGWEPFAVTVENREYDYRHPGNTYEVVVYHLRRYRILEEE